jgi:hypothetical protein
VKTAVQQAEMMETLPLDSGEQSSVALLSQRLRQMELTYREAEGLRNPSVMHEESVINRYRLLAGRFHELMKEDVAAMRSEIDELRKLNREQR